MLGSFQSLYPTGSLLTELVQIYNGKYIVRASLQIEGVTRITAMSASDCLEDAEDRATKRAMAIFGAIDTVAAPNQLQSAQPVLEVAPLPETVTKTLTPATKPSPVSQPEMQPTQQVVEVAPVPKTVVNTPTPQPEIKPLQPTLEVVPVPETVVNTPTPQPEIKPLQPTLDVETKLPLETIAASLEIAEPKSSEDLGIGNNSPNFDLLPQSEEIIPPSPTLPATRAKTAGKAKAINQEEIPAPKPEPSEPGFDAPLENFVPSFDNQEEIPFARVAPNRNATHSTQLMPNDYTPPNEMEIPPAVAAPPTTTTTTNKRKKKAEPADQSDDIAKISVEMQRLSWTTEQGRDYLVQKYGKRSRHLLTTDELRDFRQYLESQPTPDDPLAIDPIAGF